MDSFDGWQDVPAEVKENNDVASGPDAIGTPFDPTSVTLVDADLGASKPVPEPTPTRKQIGEWRAANFTVRHSVVNACGHKLDLKQFPSNANCWECWNAFFSVSPEGVASVHQLLLNGGTQAVIAMHGKKFTKMFGKFLQKKLLKEYASPASGIEGSIMSVTEEKEASLGIR